MTHHDRLCCLRRASPPTTTHTTGETRSPSSCDGLFVGLSDAASALAPCLCMPLTLRERAGVCDGDLGQVRQPSKRPASLRSSDGFGVCQLTRPPAATLEVTRSTPPLHQPAPDSDAPARVNPRLRTGRTVSVLGEAVTALNLYLCLPQVSVYLCLCVCSYSTQERESSEDGRGNCCIIIVGGRRSDPPSRTSAAPPPPPATAPVCTRSLAGCRELRSRWPHPARLPQSALPAPY